MRRPVLVIAALVAVAALVAGACSGPATDTVAEGPQVPPSTTAATTTLPPPPPVWPLTGLPTTDVGALARPAVVVKMDNSPEARPQAGINQADVVYELLVEGITRYALVFHSTPGEPVGPVRSARSSDPQLVADLGTPLLAWSGGNAGVVGEVRAAQAEGVLVDAGVDAAGGQYWRDKARKAPHNLYTSIEGLWGAGRPGAGTPGSLFAHRAAGAPAPVGDPTPGVTIRFGGGVNADYVWDAAAQGWARFQVDARHKVPNSATVDAAGAQVAPANVVVLFVPYGQSPSDARSPMAISVGSGDALVLTDGKLIHGTWSRPSASSPWALADAAGAPIALTPGRTWVGLPQVGSTVAPLDAAAAASLLATRG